MAKYEIYKDTKGEFRFRLKAGNGENILSGEGYAAKSGCKNGIASVQKNCGSDSNYEKKESSNGKHYFNLKASNGQVIGTSQMYSSTSSRNNGIDSVKRNGTTEVIDDLS